MNEMWRFKVRFRVGRSTMDMAGLLDMLRYDAATVRDWDNLGDGMMSVTLVTNRPPTIDRWLSFCLRPIDIEKVR